MRCFLWLLFLSGSLGNPLSVTPENLSIWEGSCVTISCKIKEEHSGRPINQVSFAWYFNPSFDNDRREFSGELLYKSNQTATEVLSERSNRVKFVGDLKSENCSLKISQLRRSDTGTYGIRFYWKSGLLPKQQKWLSKVTITVRGTPSELIQTKSPQMEENNTYIVACSIPYHCLDEPIKLSIQGLEGRHLPSPKSDLLTTNIEIVKTEQTFMATWEDHEKQLTCLLKTYDGRETTKQFANLMVKYAPKGVKVNADPGGAVKEGNKLTLECTVRSSNPPGLSYQWFKDGKIWNDWLPDARREFYSLKETDSGSYSCKAKNDIGSINSGSLTIDVQYPPKVNIIMPPSPIQEKNNVVLRCSATGNPPIGGYKWYKSSTSGIITTGSELRLEAIQPENSDTYHCVVHNEIGNSNASVTLNVHYRPKDVQLFHLNHLPIKEGDQVILNCSVGSSYPSINYYIFVGSSGDTRRTPRSSLVFIALPALHTSYRCEACNSVGCTSSPSITFDVLYGPKDVRLSQEPSGLVLEGNSVHLTCSVSMANPKELSYTWYKDGQLLPLNSTEKVLFIQNVQSMDSGIYHCVSKNIITNAESPIIRLKVNYGPRNVHLTLDKKAVIEGMDVNLRCDNDAYPSVATYKWYWKGEEIFMESSKILVLRKIKVEQSGEYHCEAFNSISNKESQLITISVSYSKATLMKRTLISLGMVLAIIILLGLLIYGLKKWKKKTRSDIGSTQRTGSFFVRKAKREGLPNNNSRPNGGRTGSPLDCQNEEQDGTISYARLQFAHSGLQDRTIYSSVMQPKVGLDSSENSVIYSVVKKPSFHPKNDTKMDYENVTKKEEEELHYSSLVNLAPRSRPTNIDLETDSESEDSIQYAALKH
ncbi:B-cell receptor CD22-like [Pantherophis guttatus]|uniref:B-cell receptor CD22 n=1 Tax=Pantherophis guttatus TaxID=94885 RepID=A0A6P9C5I8_PANGU|nr:B-cell receptor CD22-like [Pantherophis guttatus]